MDDQIQIQWRAETTKRYTARISPGVWDNHKDAIIAKYNTGTLESTRSWMENSLSLSPSENQIRRQLRKWGIFKYGAEPPASVDGINDRGKTPATPPKSTENENVLKTSSSPESSQSPRLQETGAKRKADDTLSLAEQTAKRQTPLSPIRRNAVRVYSTGSQSDAPLSPNSVQTTTTNRRFSFESLLSVQERYEQMSASENVDHSVLNHPSDADLKSLDLDMDRDENTLGDIATAELKEAVALSPSEQNDSASTPSPPEEQEQIRSHLIIDLAASASDWRAEELERVRYAADFLFSCGLLEDAFPLYVFLWKQLDDSMASIVLKHSIVLSCRRSASTDLHISMVENLLEKELDMDRDLYAFHYVPPAYTKSYACLFRLLLASIHSSRKDEKACIQNLELASKHFLSLDSLVKSFVELRTRNVGCNTGFLQPENEFHQYPKSWMLDSILPQTIEFKPSSSDLSQERQASKNRSRILQYQLPTLLSTSAFFDYDIFGLLGWCKNLVSVPLLKAAIQSKLNKRFGLYKSRPEIALASYFWESWQQCKIPGERPEHVSTPLESHIGPRTFGVDSVSIAEIIVVVSSLLLADKLSKTGSLFSKDTIDEEKFPAVINANHARLLSLKTDTLHEKFRKRHLLLIDRQRYRTLPESRRRLRRLVESSLDIKLPEAASNAIQERSSEDPWSSKKPGIPEINQTLAKSLHPSEDSSFRKFASHARQSFARQSSQISRKSAIMDTSSTAARSLNRPLSILSSSLRSLSISDSAQIAFLDIAQIPESPDDNDEKKI